MVTGKDVEKILDWENTATKQVEIPFKPARVLLQILDDGSVSAKPRKKSKNELLVRLYGTYEYMYVDASKSNYEFEDVLKRENKTMKEMFQEALEQDMSLMLPKGQSKLESSKTEGDVAL